MRQRAMQMLSCALALVVTQTIASLPAAAGADRVGAVERSSGQAGIGGEPDRYQRAIRPRGDCNPHGKLYEHTRERPGLRAQLRAAIAFNQHALGRLAGISLEELPDVADVLCKSYVLIRAARESVSHSDDARTRDFVKGKNWPNDKLAAKQLEEARAHVHRARRTLDQTAWGGPLDQLVLVGSEELQAAIFLTQLVLRRI